MFSIIIGSGAHTETLINALLLKGKNIILLGKPQELKHFMHLKIMKTEIDTENLSEVKREVEKQIVEKIYIASDDDQLNLMIAESLAHEEKLAVFFRDEKTLKLVTKAYMTICEGQLIGKIINEEVL